MTYSSNPIILESSVININYNSALWLVAGVFMSSIAHEGSADMWNTVDTSGITLLPHWINYLWLL